MTKAANNAKTRWNAAHYKQVKVYVDTDTAAMFKAACESAGASMSSVLSSFMAQYSGLPAKGGKKVLAGAGPFSTKHKRRKLVDAMVGQLELIRDAQEASMDNIPENLRGADAYEAAQESIELMDQAIDLLSTVY